MRKHVDPSAKHRAIHRRRVIIHFGLGPRSRSDHPGFEDRAAIRVRGVAQAYVRIEP